MDIHRLNYVLHQPEESHGWMYRAEITDLQGCMAWGDTPAETLDELLDVARMIIQLRKENGEPVPERLLPLDIHKGSLTIAA